MGDDWGRTGEDGPQLAAIRLKVRDNRREVRERFPKVHERRRRTQEGCPTSEENPLEFGDSCRRVGERGKDVAGGSLPSPSVKDWTSRKTGDETEFVARNSSS